MGKRNDKWGKHAGSQHAYDGRPWDSWQPSHSYKDKQKGSERQFPSYDVDWKQQDLEPIVELRAPTPRPTPTSFTRQVQIAVNIARKHDIRVAKLAEEQATKERRWKAYTTKMQQAFMQEHAKHRANLNKLKKETEEAMEAQKQAQMQLRDIFINAGSTKEIQGSSQGTAHAEWEAMMAGPQSMDLDGELAEAEAMKYAQTQEETMPCLVLGPAILLRLHHTGGALGFPSLPRHPAMHLSPSMHLVQPTPIWSRLGLPLWLQPV